LPDFQAAGLAMLYQQALRHAHPARWAQLTGLPFIYATLDGHRWREDEVRRELATFLAGRREWPTLREFRAAGHLHLRTAVNAFGGPERWADEMRVDLPNFRRRRTSKWTYPRMREEIAHLTRGRTAWPPQAEFKAAGLAALYKRTREQGLRRRLSRDLGLTPPHERPSPRRWTDDQIRATLDDFLKGRTTWPTHREFQQAGLSELIRKITERGQRDQWARNYNLDPPPPPFRWTETEIKAALDTFLEGRHEWPTWSEFKKAGLVGLISNLTHAGTQRAWAQRYGLSSGG
jgi:hypothetical protein